MPEPTIYCPNCKSQIPLTESLAAPLIEATKKQFQQRLDQKEAEIGQREAALRQQQSEVAKAREAIDEQVAARLKTERTTIAAHEAKRAREAMADEIARASAEKTAAEELLKERDAKLAAAQKNELELRRDRQRLEEERQGFELEKQRALDAERAKIREAAMKDADEQSRFKLAEKEKTISDLQIKLQDALRKAEQGSQQLQGEVQELELEHVLRTTFPSDIVEPVPKGEFGGDVLHKVFGPLSLACGSILWESKRTSRWNDAWLAKLRDDQRAAKAELTVIVSQVLPKEVKTLGCLDGVWVTGPQTVVEVALLLRYGLIEVARARQAGEGQQTKMELVYEYLTGPRFRHFVQAILEKFEDMRDDLEKERKSMTRQWAKREEQIRGLLTSTASLYGDLQGIAGKSLAEIETLELAALPASESSS